MPYDHKKIVAELTDTALGKAHYGNALRVAKDMHGVTLEDRSVLDRFATGANSAEDGWKLQDIANRIETAQLRTQVSDMEAELNDTVDRYSRMLNEDRRDAERFRKLAVILQQSYNGQPFETDAVTVYCSMQSGWRDERTVQADIRWKDKRDEDLNFGAALDGLNIIGVNL